MTVLFTTCMKGGAVSIAVGGLMLLATSLSAAPPSVMMANPPNHAVVTIGDNVYLRARVLDFDPGGQVTQVDYYTNGVLLGSATAAPFAVWWTNALGTNVEVRAVATDIAMERATSFVVRVTAEPPRMRNLMWTSSTSSPGEAQWNTRDFKWTESAAGGRSALFHPGDSVIIYSWDPVFIGIDGVAIPVSPSAITSWTAMMLYGGDILTGSLAPNSIAVLTNYAGSLSFPGGTVIGRNFSLTYNIARAPQNASVHLGTGPITVMDSRFNFDLVTNQFATLENDFYFEAQQSGTATLQAAAPGNHNATAKFTGTMNLNGLLNVKIENGLRTSPRPGERDVDYHEWAGPIILNQSRIATIGLYAQGQSRSKGLLLSGNIKDGGGTGTNRLTLRGFAVPVIRVSGSNTYARGTLIDLPAGGPPCWIEVAPESSLGFGDVEVRGTLHLMGNGNINSNAAVNLTQGQAIIDSDVKVRVSRLMIFGNTYTAGVFSSTNSFNRIVSNGTIRVPAVNLQPTVAIAQPAGGTGLNSADAVEIRAQPADQDSYIERVEFYLDGALAGTRMSAPFSLSVSNVSSGAHTVHAVVHDDDGGAGISAPVTFTVAPGIDAIRYVETNAVVIEFRAVAGQSIELQASDSLAPAMWSTIGSFSGAAETVSHVVTNSIPAGVSMRYYRLRSQ